MTSAPLAAVFALCASSGASDPAAAARNVVMIVADDHGCDTGAYGNTEVRTPHLDALAAQGTSTVSGIGIIDRGYESFRDKLAALGASVE